MTLGEIKDQVMFQTNNDAEDVGDFEPHIAEYVNDGYDRIVNIWARQHVFSGSENYPSLNDNMDEPNVPEWTHRYLADWATWLVYRNGNPQKQNRGYAFRESFLTMLTTLSREGGADGMNEDGTLKKYNHFFNIPR